MWHVFLSGDCPANLARRLAAALPRAYPLTHTTEILTIEQTPLRRSCLTSRSSSVALRSEHPDSSFHRLFSPVTLLSYHTIDVFAGAYIVVLSARTTASALLAHTFKLRVSPPLLRNLKARTAFRAFRCAFSRTAVSSTRHLCLKVSIGPSTGSYIWAIS